MAASAGGKSLRARCGVPLRPPCARWPPSSVASGGGVVSRQPPLSSSRSGGASAQPPSPPPSPPASLCAGNQGRGACSSGLWPPRRCGGAPLRSSPAPRFWPRGGAILVSLRRVWGLRRLRAALKVYRAARAAQCKCGVHGFAMNPYVSLRLAAAPYYREARVTVVWRQSACGMRHRWRSPHCGDWR